MNIQLPSGSYTVEEILKMALTEHLSTTEQMVIQHIQNWHNDTPTMTFQTSGSTGVPKQIIISKEKISYSAKATFQHIDPKGEITNCLLCIPPQFIGGAMVIFRALIHQLDLTVIEPTSTPCESLKQTYDLASFVPLQYQQMQPKDFDLFKNIIVGGAPIFQHKESRQCSVYSSFGMTETVSHFALKNLKESYFRTVGDANIRINTDSSLEVKGTITNNKWLQTNDLINLINHNTFEWIGRKDFIINSGGIKLNPEKIESILSNYIKGEFIISAVPDERLNEKMIVLITEKQDLDFKTMPLSKYEIPKDVIFVEELPKTASGKVNRIAAKQLATKRI